MKSNTYTDEARFTVQVGYYYGGPYYYGPQADCGWVRVRVWRNGYWVLRRAWRCW